jgi:sugar-specific transcriptional regulator TrmB
MNIDLLKKIGLTDAQARTYLVLIQAGKLTPQQLAKQTKEARTTAYMALAKLEEIGLATASDSKGIKIYEPASPSALETFISKRRQELDAVETTYRNSLSEMLSHYFERQSKPGVRFYSGKEGLQEIYKDHLKSGEPVQVVRTTSDEEFGQVLYEYMDARAEQGITAEILGPALTGPMKWAEANNKRLKRKNYWVPPEYYTAPVEVSIYGDTVSLISFGKETVGIII